tara:strand:- start:453 stop:812 length:360 start_codon:yes stop_codon:yes gene_type:complete
MASTRNKNTLGNYSLEQKQNSLVEKYELYSNSQYGQAYVNEMPAVGVSHGSMPREVLSKNPVEIESMLFGINSTNLVNPQAEVKPKLKKLPERTFFERPQLIMPAPLVIENNQRPLPLA